MESANSPRMRLRLICGKYRVIKVDRTALSVQFTIDLGNTIKMTISVPPNADITEGDLLTLYTEVFTHANTQQSSIQ